jgi:hypothetical protein
MKAQLAIGLLAAFLLACDPVAVTPVPPADTQPIGEEPANPPMPSLLAPRDESPGWRFAEVPYRMREGSAYAIGEERLFVWGGAVDRIGGLEDQGALIDLETGTSRLTTQGPLEGRYLPAVVWTGEEFIVFGGHSFDDALVDAAAFDPERRTWRPIPSAPLAPAPYPAATWTGTEMVVWLPEQSADFASLPEASGGQLAGFNPRTGQWRPLQPPPVEIVGAALFSFDNRMVLAGGPTMSDVGIIGLPGELVIATLAMDTGRWSVDVPGPTVENGRPVALPDGRIAILSDSGSLHVFDGSGWQRTLQLPDPCWWDVGAAAGGGNVYLKSCANYQVHDDNFSMILANGAYGSTGNLYAATFLATVDGRLITLGRLAEDPGAVTVLGVFDPKLADS